MLGHVRVGYIALGKNWVVLGSVKARLCYVMIGYDIPCYAGSCNVRVC